MAEIKKSINTRIILRNDTLAKWNASDKPLLKGEAALALRTDGKYEIRFGAQDGLSTWSMLSSTGQLAIPAKNVEFLTYQEYALCSLTPGEGESSRFQLYGKKSSDGEWLAIGNSISVPEVDFGPVNDKIDFLSDEIGRLCTELSVAVDDLSTSLSTTVDSLVSTTKSDILTEVEAVSGETLVSAAYDATTKASNALTAAQKYSRDISAELSNTVSAHYDELKDLIAGGIHFVGKVTGISSDTTATPNIGYYTQIEPVPAELTDWTVAKNGDLVILSSVEYVWASSTQSWEKFGDEGDWASKSYVDTKAATAKSEAIAATKNTVVTSVDVSIDDCADGTNTGDVQIIKNQIGSTGKYEYVAYTWDADKEEWFAMDGNYSADNVIMPSDMTITYPFGRYSATIASPTTLTCAGMTVKNFINDAFAETKQPTITNPSFSFGGRAGGSGEVGTTYNVNGATLTFNQGSYTYGPTPDCKAIAGVKLERESKTPYTGTTVEAAEATTTENKGAGQILSIPGSSVNVNYIDGDVKYVYKYTVGYYTDSTISANNNLGGLSNPVKCIKANTTALTNSTEAKFTGWRKPFWGTKTGSTMLDLDNLTSNQIRTLGNSGTSQAGLPTSWTVPAGTQQIIFACKAGTKNSISVTDVTNPKAPYTIAFTKYASKVNVEGANSYTATAYDIFEAHMGDPFTDKASLTISWS